MDHKSAAAEGVEIDSQMTIGGYIGIAVVDDVYSHFPRDLCRWDPWRNGGEIDINGIRIVAVVEGSNRKVRIGKRHGDDGNRGVSSGGYGILRCVGNVKLLARREHLLDLARERVRVSELLGQGTVQRLGLRESDVSRI
jgi:hypothetical protein